ncbi:hypothetical protein G6F24_013827 [Rhizopus arrhizus]|nr:hypothetical protein G6F24_013827 [Rhizopus arrhizus]
MAAGDQLLDHGDDLRHVRGHFRLDVRRHHAQRGHVFTVGGGEAVGDGADRHPLFARGGVDLVVDVGDVAGVAQCAEAPPQQVGQHPEHHRATGVADVHVVVDRRAAHIQGRTGRIERGERFELASQVVVQAQGHGDVAGGQACDFRTCRPLWGHWLPPVDAAPCARHCLHYCRVLAPIANEIHRVADPGLPVGAARRGAGAGGRAPQPGGDRGEREVRLCPGAERRAGVPDPARDPHRGALRAGLDPDPGPGQRDRRGAGRGQGPDQPLLGLGALDVQAQR